MKLIILIFALLLNCPNNFAQLTFHLLDNFNRADNPTIGSTPTNPTTLTWNELETSATASISIVSNSLLLGSTTAGRDYCYVDMSSVSGYPTTLNTAAGIVTWAFNMRSTRSSPSGFNSSNYGIAFILCKSTNDVSTGDGYAVVIGNSGDPDPIRLARFTDGPDLNSNFTDIISGSDISTDYLSIRVTYNPTGDLWSLYVENNSSAFPQTDPTNTSTPVGSATSDNTYSGSSLIYMGPFWNHGTSATDNATFDDIFVSDPNNQLPVELTSFSASRMKDGIKLDWRTETEVNNYGFEIERAAPLSPPKGGKYSDWLILGFVEGHGNSNSPKEYSFVDNTILNEKYSYRLKQIDNDGTFSYSKIVDIGSDFPLKYELDQNYPNPFNPTTTIKFTVPETEKVTVEVFNLLGQEVAVLVNKQLEAGTHEVNFNAIELNSGIYFYRIEAGNFVKVNKMTLLK